MDFSKSQKERYHRNIILDDIGTLGQMKLQEGKVLIIGAGGLGSSAALYLTAAGIGTIGIADGDVVELSNLQRQILHSTDDLTRPKVDSAKEKMEAINPETKIITYNKRVTPDNITEIIGSYDFIIDATDNFESKFLINDACVLSGKAFSHGGILEFEGQAMTHIPKEACFRCIFEGAPPEAPQAGVLGAVAGMLGTVQAAEAIKYVLGMGELLVNRILTVNTLQMDFRIRPVRKNADCPVCGTNPTITKLGM
ncbi:ThiF family adenylyltransferase [Candidatus Omnitrophota bacterium]